MNYLCLANKSNSFVLGYIFNCANLKISKNYSFIKYGRFCNVGFFRRYISDECNPYKVLGVSNKSSQEEIKKKFFELAKKYHPDINPSNESKNKMNKILSAYEILSDPIKRKSYDESVDPTNERNTHFASNLKARFSDGTWVFNSSREFISTMPIFRDLIDFERLFLKNFKGSDIDYSLNIDFFDAINGTTRIISTNSKFKCNNCNGNGSFISNSLCPHCNGNGVIKLRKDLLTIYSLCEGCNGTGHIKVDCKHCAGTGTILRKNKVNISIKKGIRSGQKIRVIGGGNYGFGGYGDLNVTVQVTPHSKMKWVNNNIHVNIQIPIKTAILGGETQIPDIRIKNHFNKLFIPANTDLKTPIVLKKKGPPVYGSNDFGDYIIHLSTESTGKDSIEGIDYPKKMVECNKNLSYKEDLSVYPRYTLISKKNNILRKLTGKLLPMNT